MGPAVTFCRREEEQGNNETNAPPTTEIAMPNKCKKIIEMKVGRRQKAGGQGKYRGGRLPKYLEIFRWSVSNNKGHL